MLNFSFNFCVKRKILNGGHTKIVIDSPRQIKKELGGQIKERGFCSEERERERERTERKRLSLRNKQIQLEIIVSDNKCDRLRFANYIEKSQICLNFSIISPSKSLNSLTTCSWALFNLRRDIIPKENENRDLVGLVTSWGSSNNHSSFL